MPLRRRSTVYYDAAKRRRTFPPTLRDAMRASVDRKLELFSTDGNPSQIPRDVPYRELLGRELMITPCVGPFAATSSSRSMCMATSPTFDPAAAFSARLAGKARSSDSGEPAIVAAAVRDGLVQAVTRTYRLTGRGSDASSLLRATAFQQEASTKCSWCAHRQHQCCTRTHFARTSRRSISRTRQRTGIRHVSRRRL